MNGTSTTDEDKEYWDYNDGCVDWSEGCRIDHEEPTHYYSIMRRREKRVIFTFEPKL